MGSNAQLLGPVYFYLVVRLVRTILAQICIIGTQQTIGGWAHFPTESAIDYPEALVTPISPNNGNKNIINPLQKINSYFCLDKEDKAVSSKDGKVPYSPCSEKGLHLFYFVILQLEWGKSILMLFLWLIYSQWT